LATHALSECNPSYQVVP